MLSLKKAHKRLFGGTAPAVKAPASDDVQYDATGSGGGSDQIRPTPQALQSVASSSSLLARLMPSVSSMSLLSNGAKQPDSANVVANALSALVTSAGTSHALPSSTWDQLLRAVSELSMFHGNCLSLRAALQAYDAAARGLSATTSGLGAALHPLKVGRTSRSSVSSSTDALTVLGPTISSKLNTAFQAAVNEAVLAPLDHINAIHDVICSRIKALATAYRDYASAAKELAQLQKRAASTGTAAAAASNRNSRNSMLSRLSTGLGSPPLAGAQQPGGSEALASDPPASLNLPEAPTDDSDDVVSVSSSNLGHAAQLSEASSGQPSAAAAPPPDSQQGRLVAKLSSSHAQLTSMASALLSDLAVLSSQQHAISERLRSTSTAAHLAYLQAVGEAAAAAAGGSDLSSALEPSPPLATLRTLATPGSGDSVSYGWDPSHNQEGVGSSTGMPRGGSNHGSPVENDSVDIDGLRRAVSLASYSCSAAASVTVLTSPAWLAHITGSYLTVPDVCQAGQVSMVWAEALVGAPSSMNKVPGEAGDAPSDKAAATVGEGAVQRLWLTAIRSGALVVHSAPEAGGLASVNAAATACLRARFWSRALGFGGLPLPVWSAGHALASRDHGASTVSRARFVSLAEPSATDVLALLRLARAEAAAGGKIDAHAAKDGDMVYGGGDDEEEEVHHEEGYHGGATAELDTAAPALQSGGDPVADAPAGNDSALPAPPAPVRVSTRAPKPVPTCRWAVMIEQDVTRSYAPGLTFGHSAAVERATARLERARERRLRAAEYGFDDETYDAMGEAASIPAFAPRARTALPWWPSILSPPPLHPQAPPIGPAARTDDDEDAIAGFSSVLLWPYQARLRSRGRRSASVVTPTLPPAARAALQRLSSEASASPDGLGEPTATAYELELAAQEAGVRLSLESFLSGALTESPTAPASAATLDPAASARPRSASLPSVPSRRRLLPLVPKPSSSDGLGHMGASTASESAEPAPQLAPLSCDPACDEPLTTELPPSITRRRWELRVILLAAAACEPGVRYTQGMNSVARLLLEAAVAACGCGDGVGEDGWAGQGAGRCRCDSSCEPSATDTACADPSFDVDPVSGATHVPRHVVLAFGWFRALLRLGTAVSADSDAPRPGLIAGSADDFPLIPPPFSACLASLFAHDLATLRLRLYQLERLMLRRLPSLHTHLAREGLPSPAAYASPWLLTLFSSFTALDAHQCLALLDRFVVGGWPEVMSALIGVLAAVAPALQDAPMEDCLAALAAPRAFYGVNSEGGACDAARDPLAMGATLDSTSANRTPPVSPPHIALALVTEHELEELEADYLSLPSAAHSGGFVDAEG